MKADEMYSLKEAPPEWGSCVAFYNHERAKEFEEADGRFGEYQRTLSDERLRDTLLVHAKLYSLSLWNWTMKNTPEDILTWVEIGRKDADFPVKDRLFYLLVRQETMCWWLTVGKTAQSEVNIRSHAIVMKSCLSLMQMAADFNDIEFFEHFVRTKRRGRYPKRPSDLKTLLLQYWMQWSLWDGNHRTTVQNFRKRLGVATSVSSVSKAVKKLGLRPKG